MNQYGEIIFCTAAFIFVVFGPNWFNNWTSSKNKKRQANIIGRFLLNSTDVNTIYQFVLETRYLSPDLAEKLLSRIDELKRDSKWYKHRFEDVSQYVL